jgi:hypothetical protein
MAQEDGAAAGGGFDKVCERIKAGAFAGLAVFLNLADAHARAGEIIGAPQHQGDGIIAVASGAAGFLIVALD